MCNPNINWKTHDVTFGTPTPITDIRDEEWGGCEISEIACVGEIDKEETMEEEAEHLVPKEFHKFLDVFGRGFFEKLPPNRAYNCRIDWKEGAVPPKGPIYSMSPAEAKALKEYFDEELALGKIRPSNSPARLPVMFVKKGDGTLRLVVDYRKLNDITIKKFFPIPRQDQLLDTLRGAKFFTKFDLRQGYNNMLIEEGHPWLSAFGTMYGQYKSLVMPFGLANAPSEFQYMMVQIFKRLEEELKRKGLLIQPGLYQNPGKGVVCYLDNIMVYGPDHQSVERITRWVLDALRTNELFLKASKCMFYSQRVNYIGLIITPEGMEPEEGKTEAIRTWPAPMDPTRARRWLGFAGFYRRFVPDFSKLMKPISDLTRHDAKWVWTEECQQTFEELTN